MEQARDTLPRSVADGHTALRVLASVSIDIEQDVEDVAACFDNLPGFRVAMHMRPPLYPGDYRREKLIVA